MHVLVPVMQWRRLFCRKVCKLVPPTEVAKSVIVVGAEPAAAPGAAFQHAVGEAAEALAHLGA